MLKLINIFLRRNRYAYRTRNHEARQGIHRQLANGIDPFSDKPVPDGDIINNVKLSRCFFYISGILEKVIENGGEVAKPQVTEAVRPH